MAHKGDLLRDAELQILDGAQYTEGDVHTGSDYGFRSERHRFLYEFRHLSGQGRRIGVPHHRFQTGCEHILPVGNLPVLQGRDVHVLGNHRYLRIAVGNEVGDYLAYGLAVVLEHPSHALQGRNVAA